MDKKVPAIEPEFLIDQRMSRKMGRDDCPVTAILNIFIKDHLAHLHQKPSKSAQVHSQSMIKSLCSSESERNTTV